MRHPHFALTAALGLLVLTSGCITINDSDRRYPRTRADSRTVERRQQDRLERRIARDAAAYVNAVDRAVRLDRDQEEDVEEALTDYVERFLENRNVAEFYPFPRFGRRLPAGLRTFWNGADDRIRR